nr:hypothetical protein [Acidimicrobiia bacterium]
IFDAVRDRRADAGVIFEPWLAHLVRKRGLSPDDVTVVWRSQPFCHCAFTARPGLAPDIAARFVELAEVDAPAGATFQRLDARALPWEGEFDTAISLCQGAFGLDAAGDADVLSGMARALRPGGRLAVSAFSAYFQLRWLEEGDAFDADLGVNHERAVLRGPDGVEATFDLWTTCFTPRELRLLADRAGLVVQALHSVTPGRYGPAPPSLAQPELLLIAERASTLQEP